MDPSTKQKLITASVVFGGIVALAMARKLGADPDWVTIGGIALSGIAGSLHSMVFSAVKP